MTIIHPCAIRAFAAIPLVLSSAVVAAEPAPARAAKPNIILCMTDDQGWGDASYNGLKAIPTPNLDAMAAAGLRFDRFYSAHPSCSPTRASVMTGRHPNRSGVFWPGMPLRKQEMTIAQAVRTAGYATGHFGKWHLSGGKPGMGRALPASDPLHPGHFGFDEWFTVSNWFDTDWTFSHQGEPVKVPGDGSDAIVAQALKFIAMNAQRDTPFLAVVWFGSPHIPLKPTAADLQAAGGSPYYGELRGVDRAMGTLRARLRQLGIADHTMLWFNSDNGAWLNPKAATPDENGSNGVLRGGKGEVWEGGIRVPGLIEWPARIKQPSATSVPVVTSDIYPTIVELLGIKLPNQNLPLDGISLLPLIDGKMTQRPAPIGFWAHGNGSLANGPAAWNDNRYKLHKLPGGKYELYDIPADISEKSDLAAQHPEVVARMKAELKNWQQSVLASNRGEDYPEKTVIKPDEESTKKPKKSKTTTP
jgi:arylsulfatase A-like enzyme